MMHFFLHIFFAYFMFRGKFLRHSCIIIKIEQILQLNEPSLARNRIKHLDWLSCVIISKTIKNEFLWPSFVRLPEWLFHSNAIRC